MKTIDKILARGAFRWTLNGEVCRHCYSSFDMYYVLKMYNLILVEKIDDDTAFVRGSLP